MDNTDDAIIYEGYLKKQVFNKILIRIYLENGKNIILDYIKIHYIIIVVKTLFHQKVLRQ